MREATRDLKKLKTPAHGPRAPGHWPQNPLLAESLGPRTDSALRLYVPRSPGEGYGSQQLPRPLAQGKKAFSGAPSSPDLMGLLGSVRAIFCSSGICSHLKCRLQSNPKGQRRVRMELRAEPFGGCWPPHSATPEILWGSQPSSKAVGHLCSHSFIQNETGLCLCRVPTRTETIRSTNEWIICQLGVESAKKDKIKEGCP